MLGSIIDETQTGFIPKRRIANNIRLVLDLLDYAELVKEESFILLLDFYKAFDSLEHTFILQSLHKFGFGDFFCKTIRTLYKNGNCSINLKSGTSRAVTVSVTTASPAVVGCHRGCLLPPAVVHVTSHTL